MSNLQVLLTQELDELLKMAWDIRVKNFEPTLTVSAPSAKTYITDHFRNTKNNFVNISLTGTHCELNCEHCKRKLLESMLPAPTPAKLIELGDRLVKKNCEGVLLSGGALASGSVPLDPFYDAIKHLKQIGLKVIVHTGLVEEQVAHNLKSSGVDQVLIDIIGDAATIREVYHLDKTPDDFDQSLRFLNGANLSIAPHIVIGLHFGKIKGEYNAIEIISRNNPEVIVLVVLSPIYDTPMYGSALPSAEEIARIAAITRIMNPETPVTLGCVRPPGSDKLQTEKLLIRAGVNGITYPMDETIDFGESLGLKMQFQETCCSLLSI
ncbi:MAG: radical SAM protein [Thermoplasmata archaeon]|nr:radical SAM protein [Thermoplasmata archaeon]